MLNELPIFMLVYLFNVYIIDMTCTPHGWCWYGNIFDDELGSLCQDKHSAPGRLKSTEKLEGCGICSYIGVSKNCTDIIGFVHFQFFKTTIAFGLESHRSLGSSHFCWLFWLGKEPWVQKAPLGLEIPCVKRSRHRSNASRRKRSWTVAGLFRFLWISVYTNCNGNHDGITHLYNYYSISHNIGDTTIKYYKPMIGNIYNLQPISDGSELGKCPLLVVLVPIKNSAASVGDKISSYILNTWCDVKNMDLYLMWKTWTFTKPSVWQFNPPRWVKLAGKHQTYSNVDR